jgi:PTS hybrid protein
MAEIVRNLVGLVLVSHSADLAAGLRDLVAQMAPEVPVEVAGGTDDGRIGTSHEKIVAAAERAERGAGVVILADLGSAVLTTRVALEDLGDTVVFVDAPFVEGALAASVTASTGADLGAVVAAGEEAWDVRKR